MKTPFPCSVISIASMAAFAALGLIQRAVFAQDSVNQRWAVLVGVNDYAELEDLQYCKNDATAMADQLGQGGFPPENIFLLTDGASDAKNLPTKANIETRIRNVLSVADRGDLVLVGFNGHGLSAGGKTYLCPSGARFDDPERTMIPLMSVYTQLDESRASHKLLVVDACRNDALPGGSRSARASAATRDAFLAGLRAAPEGVLTLASCAEGQISWEDDSFGHSVFSHYLLEGLAGKADQEERGNRDNRVSLLELYNYANIKTKRFVLRERDRVQTPELFGRITGDFDIVLPEEITNSIGMKLKLIPAGAFMMGSGESAKRLAEVFDTGAEYFEDEHPQHRVRISRPFYLGVTEVTQGQWESVMGTRPWSGEAYVKEGPDYAVTYVSWGDAVEFCRRLSGKEGRTYRLPTEAEWEYACRAGTTTMYSFGDDASSLGDYAWYDENTWDVDEPYAHRVGQKRPNGFGLYDMHGNVWEWCSDRYDADYYAGSPMSDPTGPATGSDRVLRGGCWLYYAGYCRSAGRFRDSPVDRNLILGLRVALVPAE